MRRTELFGEGGLGGYGTGMAAVGVGVAAGLQAPFQVAGDQVGQVVDVAAQRSAGAANDLVAELKESQGGVAPVVAVQSRGGQVRSAPASAARHT